MFTNDGFSIGWERLNDVYYRNRELYTLDWDLEDQQQYHSRIVKISKFTKTIAIYSSPLRDDTSQIEIYTGSGKIINSITWNHHVNGRIQDLLWTEEEELIVVVQNGVFRIYYDFEGNFNEASIGDEASLIGMKSVKTIGSYIIILLNDWKILSIDLSQESLLPHLYRDLSMDLGEKLTFSSWDILKTNESFQILISINEMVYLVNHLEIPQQRSIDGPFKNLIVSPNKQFVALYNEVSSKVFIITMSFNKVLLEINIPKIDIDLVKWCGSDAIVIASKDSLKLFAPGGSIDFYLSDELISIETEFDGLSILTEQTLEYLTKVSSSTVDVFKIGSTSNASILLDAVDKLNKHSPKANENLRIIGSVSNLIEAINICLDASLEEFDPYWQKKLLKAVSFGKSEIELRSFPKVEISNKFVKICNNLRILNEIRSNEIGLFLTNSNYEKIGIDKLLKLLIKRQKFYESFEISKFLNLPIDLIFISWACCKIKYNPNLNEDELSQAIISKFQSVNNNSYISFEKIATSAFQEGRVNLSKILINFESLFSKQIPLLLKMDELELALSKAIDSQDIDLIGKTLLVLKNSLSLPIFFKILNNFKNASNAFEFFERYNSKLLKDYYNQADRLIDNANLDLKQIYLKEKVEENVNEEINVLIQAEESYGLIFKGSNDHKIIEQQLKLTRQQLELTDNFNIEFNGLSIIETLEKLILLNQQTKINKFCKDFNINDRKLYHVKVNFFIENSKYDELYEFLNSKKSLIGYEPILDKLLDKEENKLGLKILSKANLSYDLNINYLIKFKDYANAIDQSILKKDLETLTRLKDLVKVPRLNELIEENLQKLQSSASTTIFNSRI